MTLSTGREGLYASARTISRINSEQLREARQQGHVTLTRQQICTLRKIGRLHPRLGSLIDELGVPYYVARAIAHADGHAAQRDLAIKLIGEWTATRAAKAEPAPAHRALLATFALEP